MARTMTDWPGGAVSTTLARRQLRELNSNGDPIYIGYAPKADSNEADALWLIEAYAYNSDKKCVGIHTVVGLSWVNRAEAIYHPNVQIYAPLSITALIKL